jgi:hypothetical protein
MRGTTTFYCRTRASGVTSYSRRPSSILRFYSSSPHSSRARTTPLPRRRASRAVLGSARVVAVAAPAPAPARSRARSRAPPAFVFLPLLNTSRLRSLSARCDPSSGTISRKRAPGTSGSGRRPGTAEGRSSDGGVELKGVRWSRKASRAGIESEGWEERDAGKSP